MVSSSDTKYERMLRDRLEDEGWYAERVAGSGSKRGDSADVIAMKDGRVLIFEVKSFKRENLPLNVRNDNYQLDTIQEKSGYETWYALYEKGSREWRVFYADGTDRIGDVDELDRMFKLLWNEV